MGIIIVEWMVMLYIPAPAPLVDFVENRVLDFHLSSKCAEPPAIHIMKHINKRVRMVADALAEVLKYLKVVYK